MGGNGTPQQSAEHRDVRGHVNNLRVDLHRNPKSDTLQPGLAAVGGPLHASDEGAKATRHGVNSGRQTLATVIERLPVLYRERHQGHSLAPSCVIRMTLFSP